MTDVLSHEQLLTANPDELLAAFVTRFNDLTQHHEEQATMIGLLQQQLDGYKRQSHIQADEIKALTTENEECRELALKAEETANKTMGVTRERDRLKDQVKALQQELTKLKGGDNPKKLRDQIKRIKTKDQEQKKRIQQQEQVIKTCRHELEKPRQQQQQAFGKIAELKNQLAHDTGSGLYHNGEHHLIIWPQKTKMQDVNGNVFEGRSLLYLHQSGRGGLMTYNPETEQVNLCAAPRGGLRPSEDLKDFAQNWLFKVNELQDGIVKEEDMIPVNYNPELEAA